MTRRVTVAVVALLCGAARVALAQTGATAWGNIAGFRIGGQLLPLETSICALGANGEEARTAQERQQPSFSRTGNQWTVATRLAGISVKETVVDTRAGSATVDLRLTRDSAGAAGYFCVDLPRASWSNASVVLAPGSRQRATLPALVSTTSTPLVHGVTRGIRIVRGGRRIELAFASAADVVVRGDARGNDGDYRIYVSVLPVSASSAANTFTLTVAEPVDNAPATIALDAEHPGRAFDGMGGNFRIQNPAVDPKVIAYNLANMRVAWGRVELPWRTWQPDETADLSSKSPEQLDPRLRAAMEMARTLARRKVPVIVSAWFPPQWAVVGEIRREPLPGQPRGNQLDPAKAEKIYASITSYLLYLKQHYGVEASMFSFNESDLGIDVRQTAEEHANFIKGLGAYLAAHGLSTKLLLGDTSDATPTWFIAAAMADPATRPYIGAVSFHSWRGWTDELFAFWRDASRTLNVPLLVGEGSTDAGAWKYPSIFLEPKFAHDEIFLYVRMLAATGAASILQWQLTSDYSLLAGGGVFGDTTTLRPTQRFWSLKQLASTPPNAFHLPVACGRPDLSCAAFGDIAGGAYAVHVVNDGAARAVTVTGLPSGIALLGVWVTDDKRGMVERARVPVSGGRARLTLDAVSFTTLVGEVAAAGDAGR